MAGTLRSRNRRNIDDTMEEEATVEVPAIEGLEATSDVDIYAQEVLDSLIANNLPPTPNNFSLYFDRLLEKKSASLRTQVHSLLELEKNNDTENSIQLEQTLKQGFSSIKGILGATANLYKNMSLMTKILEQRKKELGSDLAVEEAVSVIATLEGDVGKLNSILKTQSSQMKSIYNDTAKIVKKVENDTIFDNQFGVYNKRYLLTKLEQEIELVKEFHHTSSLIMLELSKNLKKSINNEKATLLMTRTISKLLLKTSRKSDIVAHYGKGVFLILLKHTDINSAEKASERLCALVSNSTFFLADRDIALKISIGVTNIDANYSVEEIIVSAMHGIETAYTKKDIDYCVSLRS